MRDNSPSQNKKVIFQRFNATQKGVLKFGSAPIIISRNDQYYADIVRTNKKFIFTKLAKYK